MAIGNTPVSGDPAPGSPIVQHEAARLMGAGCYRELPQVTAFPPIWTGGPLIRVEAVGRSSVRKAVNLSSAAGMIQRRG